MVKKIIWTDLAIERYRQVIDYLLNNWSEQEALKLIQIVNQKLALLSRFPFLGRQSTTNNLIRQILLTKHNRLIYKIETNRIILLEIFDTRQKEKL